MSSSNGTPAREPGPLSLSVVVASYNRATRIPDLLKNLERQSLSPDEFDVIIVDDGSREPVKPVLEATPTRLRIRLIEQENRGQAQARHRGILEATGDIVVIIDDDMELAPNMLNAHREWHELGYRVVLGLIRPAKELANMPLFERFHARQLERMVQSFRNGNRPRGVHLCTGNVSFRRQDYLDIGGFDATLKRSEDRELGIRLERAGRPFAFAENAWTVHASDHTDLDVWLQRAFNYGLYDSQIYGKHPTVDNSNPWRFFFLVNPVSRPVLLLSMVAPDVGRALSRRAMKAAEWLDQHGLESIALHGTSLAYGIEYFRGMQTEAATLRRSFENMRSYLRVRRST